MTKIHETKVLDASTQIAAYQLENKLMRKESPGEVENNPWQDRPFSRVVTLSTQIHFEQYVLRTSTKWWVLHWELMVTRPAGNSAHVEKQCRCLSLGGSKGQLSKSM